MILQTSKRDYTPEEYLEFEIHSEERHEYIDGEIVLMTGGLPNHNTIAVNLSGTLNFELRRKPYRTFIADQRLWIPKKRIYTYPDVMVMQQPIQYQEGRRDTLINPVFIAEVLSKSTRSYDRGEKFEAYQTIAQFQEYLLIDQYKVHIEHRIKTDNGIWTTTTYEDENLAVSLNAVPCQFVIADLYDKVDFNAEQE
jgi:Uma2 family endonuclease